MAKDTYAKLTGKLELGKVLENKQRKSNLSINIPHRQLWIEAYYMTCYRSNISVPRELNIEEPKDRLPSAASQVQTLKFLEHISRRDDIEKSTLTKLQATTFVINFKKDSVGPN